MTFPTRNAQKPAMITPEMIEAGAKALLPVYCEGSPEWAERYWRDSKDAPHKGDCPVAEHKGPITCDRCVCDDIRKMAEAALTAALALHKPGVPGEIEKLIERLQERARGGYAWDELDEDIATALRSLVQEVKELRDDRDGTVIERDLAVDAVERWKMTAGAEAMLVEDGNKRIRELEAALEETAANAARFSKEMWEWKERADAIRNKTIEEQATMTEEQIKYMVDRFLGWKLPNDFYPDAGISFKATFNEHTAHPMRHEPVGTNLFTATQATAMVRYMIEGMPVSALATGETKPSEDK